MLSAYSSEHSKERKLFFETHFILNNTNSAKVSLQKIFDRITIKSCMPYIGNKEQKWLFLVFPLSDMYIDFDFAPPGAQIKLCIRKIWRVEVYLSSPVTHQRSVLFAVEQIFIIDFIASLKRTSTSARWTCIDAVLPVCFLANP